MFRQAVLLVSVWLCGSANLTRFAECADAARLLALVRVDRVRWAIGCGPSGSVGSMIGVGGGAGTLGGDSGTLGRKAHVLGIDGGVTLGDGAGVPGCVEIGTEGGGSAAGWLRLKIARRLSMASSWAWQLSGVLSARTAMVRARRQ